MTQLITPTQNDDISHINMPVEVSDYNAASIQVLEGLEAVRKRPGMYVGDSGFRGLHHCLWEIIDNSVDEHVAGYGNKITIRLHADLSASVQDSGRGIPVDTHPTKGISSATLAVTVLHAGGKFGGVGSAYSRSGGLHGVGASVVNALSTKFQMDIKRQGKLWQQIFTSGGKPEKDIAAIDSVASNDTGTFIRFWPDESIFKELTDDGDIKFFRFDEKTIQDRLELLSYLNPGLQIEFINDLNGAVYNYSSPSFLGILNFISAGKSFDAPVFPGIEGQRNVKVQTPAGDGEVYVRFAMQVHEGSSSVAMSFVNNIYTPGGGTHLTGLKASIARCLNQYAMNANIIKENISSEDILEGIACAVLVRLSEPQFEGQTKDKLGSKEALQAVNSAVTAVLSKYLEENPKSAKEWLARAQRASKARAAADRARHAINEERSASSGFRLPGKLADCSEQDPTKTELFFVEGDSAGGSAKQGRDRKTQAILPLKGKILNSHRAELSEVLSNIEVQNIFLALGTGIGDKFDIAKLRYHKIVIMTDADVDGAHIATLLLTFFHRYTPQLVAGGHIYLAQPPLYRMKNPKKVVYLKDDAELAEFVLKHDEKQWTRNRFKGLGEMDPEQLWDTTMNPATRTLAQVQYAQNSRDEEIFEILMGEDVPPRKKFIEEKALNVQVE